MAARTRLLATHKLTTGQPVSGSRRWHVVTRNLSICAHFPECNVANDMLHAMHDLPYVIAACAWTGRGAHARKQCACMSSCMSCRHAVARALLNVCACAWPVHVMLPCFSYARRHDASHERLMKVHFSEKNTTNPGAHFKIFSPRYVPRRKSSKMSG